MRKRWIFVAIIILFTTLFLVSRFLGQGKQAADPLYAAEGQEDSHLPVVFAPEATATPTITPTGTTTPSPTATATPTMTPTPDPGASPLENGSFEDTDWRNVEDQDIQIPPGWDMYWVPVGQPLFDAPDLASGVCECIHKLAIQLPPEEQPGGSDPLILEGGIVYKLFKKDHAWGTELSQTFKNMTPGSNWRLTVPVRVHLNGDTDQWSAESSIWVNDQGAWANAAEMGDRHWCKHEQVFTVPSNGQVRIDIRFKSKWQATKDFFIDDVTLELASEQAPHPEMDACKQNAVLDFYQPFGSR